MTNLNEAQNIFKLLDEDNNGYIISDKFISAFNQFYKPHNNEDDSQTVLDLLISKMKPDEFGRISFDKFLCVFQEYQLENSDGKHIKRQRYSIRRFLSADTAESDCSGDDGSSEMSNDRRTDNKPVVKSNHDNEKRSALSDNRCIYNHDTKNSLYDPTLLFPSAASKARNLLSAGASPRGSENHSEIISRDIENNFDILQMQMKRLEEKLNSLNNDQNNQDQKQSKRLKNENQALLQRINNLEDALNELEERSESRIQEETNELKIRLKKTEDEKNRELERLRNQFYSVENESADIILLIRQFKNESEILRADKHSLTVKLADSDTKLALLQEKFEQLRKTSKEHVTKLKEEKLYYERLIEESKDKLMKSRNTPNIKTKTMTDLSNQHQELEELVLKLKGEQVCLKQQLEEAINERTPNGNQNSISLQSSSLIKEMQNYSKEELMDILVKEKDANFKLRDYIEKLIVKIMEKHPSLLEIGNAAKS